MPTAWQNKKDIRAYIESATDFLVNDLGLDDEAPEMREHIIDSLSDRADGNTPLVVGANAYMLTIGQGMFLWVRLVIKGLLTKVNVNQMTKTLNNLPEGLDQA